MFGLKWGAFDWPVSGSGGDPLEREESAKLCLPAEFIETKVVNIISQLSHSSSATSACLCFEAHLGRLGSQGANNGRLNSFELVFMRFFSCELAQARLL